MSEPEFVPLSGDIYIAEEDDKPLKEATEWRKLPVHPNHGGKREHKSLETHLYMGAFLNAPPAE